MIIILDYFIVCLATALLFVMIYPRFYVRFNKNVCNMTSKEARDLIDEKKGLIIIDVRSREEYRNGHIKGAKSFPIREIEAKIKELSRYNGKDILVYCSSGNRSVKAVRLLLRNGFTNIYHMKRGLKDWSYNLK